MVMSCRGPSRVPTGLFVLALLIAAATSSIVMLRLPNASGLTLTRTA